MLTKLLKKIKKNRKILFISFTLLLIAVISLLSYTLSLNMDTSVSGTEAWVDQKSELIYYISVDYDGKDINGIESSNSVTNSIYSGLIYVEDKLPDGLTFDGFDIEEGADVGIATYRDTGLACRGYVVDDSNGAKEKNNYQGLHYDEATRTISYMVKNIQAGCRLTIGVKTITPAIDDPLTPETEVRRDFYNYATAREDTLTLQSNTVHVWIMNEEEPQPTLYKVKYKYDNTAPTNAPELGDVEEYAPNAKVGLKGAINVEGYNFTGWRIESPSDLEIDSESQTFVMPEKDVTIVGGFTKIPSYTVSYKLKEGTPIPPEFTLPNPKEHYAGDQITIDSLKEGATFNGYRFKGWKVENSDITVTEDNDFIMPGHNVTIVGEWEIIKYQVSYQFTGTITPPNANELLPDSESYAPGEKVTLKSVKNIPEGYIFLGWYQEVDEDNSFIMPEEDVVILGEWKGKTYTVTYRIEGEAPKDYETEEVREYYPEHTVPIGTKKGDIIGDYKFLGWTVESPDGVVINERDWTFTMPYDDVVLVGSFEKSYSVSYRIEGVVPDDYEVPGSKNYFKDDVVSVNSLKAGTDVNGYKFTGWRIESPEGTTIDESKWTFTMPASDVTIVGEFTTYKIEYQFTGDVIPPDSTDYLPAEATSKSGDQVKLPSIDNPPDGYTFLGWDREDNFTMPKEDIVVHGTWSHSVKPTIVKEITSSKNKYRPGDIVSYKITVTNPSDHTINNVIVTEGNPNAYFKEGDGYTINSNNSVTISSINSHDSISIYVEYLVTTNDKGTIENVVTITDVSSELNDILDPTTEYTAKAEFKVQPKTNLKICKEVDNVNTDKVFTFNITSDTGYEQSIRLQKDECQTLSVYPDKYQVLEVIPQEYELTRLDGGVISSNGEEFTISDDQNYEITFVNTFKRQGFFHSSGEAVNKVIKKDLYSQIEKDFGQGSNVRLYEGKVTDEVGKTENANIYYYTSKDHNNVIFADFCWQIVRTTATEGVKIVYNGVPTDGKCNNSGTAQQIGTSKFNTNHNSPAYVGYMYNTIYSYKSGSPTSGAIFGNDVTYNDGQYTLTDTDTTKDNTHHYTCNSSTSNSCATVRYYYYSNYYIELTDGKKVEDALNEMLSADDVNTKESDIKIVIDEWYEENMTDYTQYLEDTVFCNDRSIESLGGWDPNGSISTDLQFNNRNGVKSTHVCPNETDQFAMNNSKARLTYPVGLLTAPEANMMGSNFRATGAYYWLGSPGYFSNYGATERYVLTSGSLSSNYVDGSRGVRPAVSLNPGTGISDGDGTNDNPYIVEPVTK